MRGAGLRFDRQGRQVRHEEKRSALTLGGLGELGGKKP
jgi:hypothetical protein